MAIGNVQQSRTMYLSHCLIGPRCWAWELPAWRPRRALNHTDAAYSTPSCSDRERVQVQRDMELRLRQLVLRTLPPSQTLQIGVLDIDQTGRFEPFRSGTGADVCTLRDVVPLQHQAALWGSNAQRLVRAADGAAANLVGIASK